MKRRSIIAMAAALCICGSFAGCGSSSSSSESTAKSTNTATNAGTTSDQTDSTETVTNGDTTEAESENKASSLSYSPSQEIINADIHSGMIQIGNDVFRNGGYTTFGEFLDKYGDKYDIKAIKGSYDDVTYVDFDPNEEMSNQDEIRFHCVNKDDNNIILFVKVQAKRANKPGTIRDNPVYEFSSTAENNINDFTWFAGGISHKSTNPAYRDEIINIMKDDGIISAYDTKEYENTYREIDTGCNTIEVDSIIRSAEKNMYGEYPAYIYRLTDNSNASNGDVTFVLAKQYFLKEVDTSLNSDKMRETLKDPDGDGKIVVENQ